jgi:hypothetical protein
MYLQNADSSADNYILPGRLAELLIREKPTLAYIRFHALEQSKLHYCVDDFFSGTCRSKKERNAKLISFLRSYKYA